MTGLVLEDVADDEADRDDREIGGRPEQPRGRGDAAPRAEQPGGEHRERRERQELHVRADPDAHPHRIDERVDDLRARITERDHGPAGGRADGGAPQLEHHEQQAAERPQTGKTILGHASPPSGGLRGRR